MRRSVSQLERVVADLRDVERLETGSFSLEFSQVDVNAIAKVAVDSVQPLANEKGIALEATFSPHAPRVSGDATRLLQVLHNLLANSLKFTRSGGRIHVGVSEHDGVVTLTVKDTGIGLSAAKLAKLFARSISHVRAPLRSGLGLMIAREIVERHRGRVRAESHGENQGTLMTVSLPASTSDG